MSYRHRNLALPMKFGKICNDIFILEFSTKWSQIYDHIQLTAANAASHSVRPRKMTVINSLIRLMKVWWQTGYTYIIFTFSAIVFIYHHHENSWRPRMIFWGNWLVFSRGVRQIHFSTRTRTGDARLIPYCEAIRRAIHWLWSDYAQIRSRTSLEAVGFSWWPINTS